jgi:hypothetical protein
MTPQSRLHVHLDPITNRHRLYLPDEPGRPILEADETVDFDSFLRWVAKQREKREEEKQRSHVSS